MNLNRSNEEELYLLLRAMGCNFNKHDKNLFTVSWSKDKDYLEEVKGKVFYYLNNPKIFGENKRKITFQLS